MPAGNASVVRRAALFGVVFLLILFAFEAASRRLFEDSVSEREILVEARRYDAADAESFEVLVLGNSHARAGISADLLGLKTRTAAHQSQDLYYDRQYLEKYLPRMSGTKCVVLGIDYGSLGYRTELCDRKLVSVYRRAGLLPEYSDTLLSRLLAGSHFLNYRSLLLKRLALNARDALRGGDQSAPPFVFAESTAEQKRQGGAISARKHEYETYRQQNEPRMTEHLVAMIDRVLAANGRVLLLSLPVTPYYEDALSEPFKARFCDLLARCLSRYEGDDRVRYVDLFKDARFSDADFSDEDHLNPGGAAKASAIVDGLIRSDWKTGAR